jgi:hypothetical protein
MSEANGLQLEKPGESPIRDSEFNFNTGALHEGSPVLFKRGRLIDLSRSRST